MVSERAVRDALTLVLDFSHAVADRVWPAIVAEGWHLDGMCPSPLEVWRQIIDFAWRAEAIGVLARAGSAGRVPSAPFVLTDPGRAALAAALHARALAPVTTPD